VQDAGNVPEDEMYRTFNMGLGFMIVVVKEDVDQAMQTLTDLNTDAPFHVGEITKGTGPAVVEWET